MAVPPTHLTTTAKPEQKLAMQTKRGKGRVAISSPKKFKINLSKSVRTDNGIEPGEKLAMYTTRRKGGMVILSQ